MGKEKKIHENWPRGVGKPRSEVWDHFGWHAKDDNAAKLVFDKSYAVCR